MLRKNFVRSLALCIAFGTAALSWNANANLLDFDPVVGTLTGQGDDIAVFPLDVTVDTSLLLILTDLATPAPFTIMGLALTDEFGGVFAQVTGIGQLLINFDVEPGNYLAVVGGVADANVNIGTFGLEISELPVPGAIVLFASALLGVAGLSRRKSVKPVSDQPAILLR